MGIPPVGTILNGRYRVDSAPGRGPLGPTVHASDLKSHSGLGTQFGGGSTRTDADGLMLHLVETADLSAANTRLLAWQDIASPSLLPIQHVERARSGDLAGSLFVVTEHAQCTLADRLTAGSLHDGDLVGLAHALSLAIACLHFHGLFHGNLLTHAVFQVDHQWKLGPSLPHNTDACHDIENIGMVILAVVGSAGQAGSLDALPQPWRTFASRCLGCRRQPITAADLHLATVHGFDWLDERRASVSYLTGLSVTRVDRGFSVEWDDVAAGRVALFSRQALRGCEKGEWVLRSTLNGEAPLAISESGERSITLPEPRNGDGDVEFVAVSLFDEFAVVGESVRLGSVQDVDNLDVSFDGRTAAMTWRWPLGIEMATVAVRSDRFPVGPDDDNAQASLWTLHRYLSEGGANLQVRGHGPVLYATVYAAVSTADGRRYAAGCGRGARQRVAVQSTVTWRVARRSRLFGFRRRQLFKLVMRSSTALSKLPTFVLVAQQGRTPLNDRDGVVAFRSDGALAMTHGRIQLLFDCAPVDEEWAFALFANETKSRDVIFQQERAS